MRPLIVIGATDEMRQALQPYAEVGHIEHHPTAEVAHYALSDQAVSTDDRGWQVHVAYGPHAYGPLMVGHNAGTARLAHTGRTFVLCWQVEPDPGKPRRVIDGAIAGDNPDTTPWHVSAAIGADYVVDVASEVGVPFLVRLLEWKDSAHT